ncbi:MULTISPECIES: hypothetical protein [Kitasatospora]|uniref:PA14 domain-containing protein n=1 Tax=Kitasatospora setae (strain ATCC 33774 / DSM 43861 / JCM 3304 / KCC A-0304 / NBRC 14216 / KM-6054) TaxID=452652 RepID=E4NIN9_KITSK|nr:MULTISPECIES: hypothetical protein [Kitasatospora]BAJ32837.1 hypothetical protein KSE_70800 [Kitasatospora setae KM-6054]
MRRGSRHRARGAGPLRAVLTAVLLAGTTVLAAQGSAAAGPAPREWVADGRFAAPLAEHWTCTGDVRQLGPGLVEGRPGAYDFAGCVQRLPMGGKYDLTAVVSGAYAFVGVSDGTTGPGTHLWSNDPETRVLRATIDVPAGAEVYFHGWYGQGPYQVSYVSLVGPIVPDPCSTWSPTPTPGQTWVPSCHPLPLAPSTAS